MFWVHGWICMTNFESLPSRKDCILIKVSTSWFLKVGVLGGHSEVFSLG